MGSFINILGVILTMRFDARLEKIDQQTTERFTPWWENGPGLAVIHAVQRRHGEDVTSDAAGQLVRSIRDDALSLAILTRHESVIRRMVRWTPFAHNINQMGLGFYLQLNEKRVAWLRKRVANYGIPPEALVNHFA